ncbi:MAG: hypothetical protein JWR75_1405 [Devosia sp.]|nr:hypothetical protein [Devosia sp.]
MSILAESRSAAGDGLRPVEARRLLSFIGIGAAAALGFVALSTAMLAVPTGLPGWVTSTLCYAAFVVPVYLLHRRFSFASEAPHVQALPRYVAVQASAVGLATMFSYIAYGIVGLPGPVGALLVIGLTSGVNFLVLKLWAFSGATHG